MRRWVVLLLILLLKNQVSADIPSYNFSKLIILSNDIGNYPMNVTKYTYDVQNYSLVNSHFNITVHLFLNSTTNLTISSPTEDVAKLEIIYNSSNFYDPDGTVQEPWINWSYLRNGIMILPSTTVIIKCTMIKDALPAGERIVLHLSIYRGIPWMYPDNMTAIVQLNVSKVHTPPPPIFSISFEEIIIYTLLIILIFYISNFIKKRKKS